MNRADQSPSGRRDVDVQASRVLDGLRALGALLEEPEAGEALDLARNARTTEQYNILRRLKQSLTQYLERDGDLFYVGFVGHFSSGKSSTINSILDTWGSDRERETDLNPTDTTITLITSDQNAKSLLGVIREGHVTIRHESVNNPLLDRVVLADTPGSGDTQFVEEVARDFLPICDVILFFFSATSPLDKTDLPLLTEIHKRLKFIPIRFVITRADEFRIDRSKPISDANVDAVRRDRFLGDVLTRLNRLLQPMVYTEEQFILIDNTAPRYNVDKLTTLIRSKCDPTNPSARIVMHGHKLHYFQSTARELKAFFATFIDEKLRQLSKIVDTAEQNIQLYNQNVLISNNNLTKTWLDQLSSIRMTRERVQKALVTPDALPEQVSDFEFARKRRSDITKSFFTEAQYVARQIGLRFKLELSSNLSDRVEELKLWEFESDNSKTSPASEGIALNLIEVKPETILPLVPPSLPANWTTMRETTANALRDAAADLRRRVGELAGLLENRSPVAECDSEVESAQRSLTQDLSQFFRSAELYRDGVFSHTTKDSISTLGIGGQLDALESEFTNVDRETFVNETMQKLFPDHSEVSAQALTRLAALEKDIRPLIYELGELKIPSPASASSDISPAIESERTSLLRAIVGQLRSDVGHLVSRLDIQLSSAIVAANRQYEADVRTARRRRFVRYAAGVAGATSLVLLIYMFYVFVNRDVPQDMFNSILWNLVAEAIAVCLGLGLAKWWDDFPRASAKILKDARALLKGEIFKIVERELGTHEFSTLSESDLSKSLSEAYQRILDSDPDDWNRLVAERLDTLRKHEAGYRRIKLEYERLVDHVVNDTASYFSDASKNLARLNEVAERVKTRAIEPSFELLASTRESLNEVKKQIQAIEFSA